MTERRMGMWFEELTVGTKVEHAITRTLTETDNVLFTTMSMNPQPLHLDAELTLGDGLPHPDLGQFVDAGDDGLTLTEHDGHQALRIPGRIGEQHAAAVEEAIWERMHFATHLRARRLGEFTTGTDLHRSESLALVQLLIMYHLVTAKAAVAVGGDVARTANGTPERTVTTTPALTSS